MLILPCTWAVLSSKSNLAFLYLTHNHTLFMLCMSTIIKITGRLEMEQRRYKKERHHWTWQMTSYAFPTWSAPAAPLDLYDPHHYRHIHNSLTWWMKERDEAHVSTQCSLWFQPYPARQISSETRLITTDIHPAIVPLSPATSYSQQSWEERNRRRWYQSCHLLCWRLRKLEQHTVWKHAKSHSLLLIAA